MNLRPVNAAQTTILSQPRTSPGDPYPCNYWYPPGDPVCDPVTGRIALNNRVYASAWSEISQDTFGIQILADDFTMPMSGVISEVKVWGGAA
ncbi:MAG TPA: hypothetical protein ENG93_00725 [Nitrospirae bacterium]|nr:hypothetical protein [Nitrospirota bacterium]HDK41161.1 hypothetical protein [Nitrospirota bacterium]